MLLLLEFGYISIVQWYRREHRRRLYMEAVERIWRTSTVIASRNTTRSVSDRQTSLRAPDSKYGVVTFFADDRISLSFLSPKRLISLTSWTKLCNQVESCQHDMTLLLEIHKHFLECPQLKEDCLKYPLAWKSGTARTRVLFGCTLNDFVSLCDQLYDGIHVNERLNVDTITSVAVEWDSKPDRTLESSSQSFRLDCSKPNGDQDSSSDIPPDHHHPSVISKTQGEDRNPKPPNILIYCGQVDSVRRFNAVKETIQAVVNMDAFTIYHLKHDQVHSTPWQDNAVLVVISANNLHDGLESRFLSYFNSGGQILSFGSSLENYFLERKKVQFHSDISHFNMTMELGKWRDVKGVLGRFHYSRTSRAPDLNITVMAEDATEPVIVGISKANRNSNIGKAVCSQVLLGEDPTEIATDAKMFDELKPFNEARIAILEYLLQWLGIDCHTGAIPPLTPAYLLSRSAEMKTSLLFSLEKRLKEDCLKSQHLTLQFVRDSKEWSGVDVSSTHLPVLCSGATYLMYFNPDVYWQNLACSGLGQVLIYADILPTTMTLLEGLQFSVPGDAGLIAIAGRQTTGKGRGQNAWLSPVGCAMFSLHVRVPLDSNLGRRVSFLQHIASLSVVLAVLTMPRYEELDLKLKWPNDIYYSNKMKLGGVIVNSTIIGATVHAVIGCGFNVDNRIPTICINDLIHQQNKVHGTKLGVCSTEQLIARTVTHIETTINDFQKNGHEAFCEEYYKHWLHSGAQVGLEQAGGQKVEIVGLDDFGYLQVQTETGEKLSVMPDGNSFDIMHNLISMKP